MPTPFFYFSDQNWCHPWLLSFDQILHQSFIRFPSAPPSRYVQSPASSQPSPATTWVRASIIYHLDQNNRLHTHLLASIPYNGQRSALFPITSLTSIPTGRPLFLSWSLCTCCFPSQNAFLPGIQCGSFPCPLQIFT